MIKTKKVLIKESVLVNEMLLEKGDQLKILTESVDWEEITNIINSESKYQEIRGLINFVNQDPRKYKNDIKDFTDWFNMDIDSMDQLDYIMKHNKPQDTMESVPSNDWSFYKSYVKFYTPNADSDKDLFRWMQGA